MRDINWFLPDILMIQEIRLEQRHIWPHPNKSCNLRWLSPCKKSKILIGSVQLYCCPKNSVIWLDERHTWPHPTKSDSLRFSRWLILCIKKQYINWFLSEILLIKESCNLIRQDEQLTKGGILRSYIPLMIVSVYKQLRYQSIPSWDIGNSRILQSDWKRRGNRQQSTKILV